MSNLPIDQTTSLRGQNVQILQLGEAQGWFTYLGMQVRERRGAPDRFRVRMPGHDPAAEPLVLLSAEVRPWVLGVAAVHGGVHLIAYREGL